MRPDQIWMSLLLLSPFTAWLPGLAAALAAYRQKMTLWLTPLNLGLFLMFNWAVLSGLYNHALREILVAFGLLLYLGWTSYLQNHFRQTGQVERLLAALWKLGLVTAALGLLEKLLSLFFDLRLISETFWSPTYVPTREAYRIYGTFGNPNVAGDWYAALFLIGLYFLSKTAGEQRKGYLMGSLVYLLTALMTGSKGAILGLELGLLVYGAFSPSRRARLLAALSAAGLILLALVMPEIQHLTNSRTALWQETLHLIQFKPVFGWGLLGFFRQTGEIHAHNLWLSMMVMLGLGGLLALTVILLHSLRLILLLKKVSSPLAPLFAGLLFLLLGHSVFDFVLMTPQGGMLFFSLLGLMSGLSMEHEFYYSIAPESVSTLGEDLRRRLTGHPNRLAPPGEWAYFSRAGASSQRGGSAFSLRTPKL